MSLNCNLAQTSHDMPSGHPDLTDTLGYWPEDMPSGPPDIHSEHVGHLGLLGHLGYLNTLDPEPSGIPLHAFIEEEGST